jgi:anoctamin-10
VYPIAAFWAVTNNILEIRADAFKLCRLYQRPMAKRVKDTGAWQVITNCFKSSYNLAIFTKSPGKTL